jgi:hypothetical protein
VSDPAEVIEVTLGGKTFRAGRRTAAHIEWTIEQLAKRVPDATLHVIQPCYNTGVDASAGTHDKDGVLDFAILGLDWFPAQRFLRECGWAAWFRFPPAFPLHLHAVSLGCPGPLGEFVPGQILDYHAHAFGLANQHDPGSDHSWFPADIDATEFDYRAWEDRMTPQDLEKLTAAVTTAAKAAVPTTDQIVKAVLAALVDGDGTTVKQSLRLTAEAARITKKG